MPLTYPKSGFLQHDAFTAYSLAYASGGLTDRIADLFSLYAVRDEDFDLAVVEAIALGTYDRQTGREPRGPEFFLVPAVQPTTTPDDEKPGGVVFKIELEDKVSGPATKASDALERLAAISKEVEAQLGEVFKSMANGGAA